MNINEIKAGAKFEAKLMAIHCIGHGHNEFKVKTIDEVLHVSSISVEFTVKGSKADWIFHLNANGDVFKCYSIGRKNYKENQYEVK